MMPDSSHPDEPEHPVEATESQDEPPQPEPPAGSGTDPEMDAAKLQAILGTTVDGIITIDDRGVIQSFNRAAEQIFGYAAAEVVGSKVNVLMPAPHREQHDTYLANYLHSGKPKIIGIGREVEGRRKDGSLFPLYLAVSEVRAGGERYFTGILRDITEQKRAAEDLKQSEQKYRTLVESSSDSILMIDGDRRIISFNAAFLDLFGWQWHEVADRSTRILHTSEASFRGFFEQAFPSIERQGSFRCEWELMRKDGIPIQVEETMAAIQDRNGSIRGYVAVIRDITERKRNERQLADYRDHLEQMVADRTRELEDAYKSLLQEEKLKTLGTISAELAHEIRNPIMSIGGFAKRLQKKFQDIPEVAIIVQESERLEKILNRIQNYLKPVEMRPKECAVDKIITETLELLAPELAREGIVTDLDLVEGLPPAYVDPAILIQVLIIVVRNATEVVRDQRRIAIRTSESDQNIHIQVRIPVSGVKIKDPENFMVPFGEEAHSLSVPLCVRLLQSMGGYLSLSQEEGEVLFATSLLKAFQPVRALEI